MKSIKITDKLKKDVNKSTKTAIKYVLQFAVGFLLASITIDRNFAPFGIAYAANAGFLGVLGAVLGHISSGYDIWRYIIAVVVAFGAKRILGKVLNISEQVGSFFYSIWAVLVAGIGGVFIYNYSFKENALFVLSGVFSGLFAYIFAVSKKSLKLGELPSSKIRYICFSISSSIILIGIMSLGGGIFKNIGITLTIFLLLCISDKCGFFYTSTTAMFFAFGITLYDNSFIYLSGIILMGTVLATVMHDLGKFGSVIGFLLSNVLVSIYYSGMFNVWETLFNILISGMIYIFMPKRILDNFLKLVVPFSKKKEDYRLKKKVVRKISGNSKKRLLESEKNEIVAAVCKKCNRKMLCWIKNYDYTLNTFNKMSSQVNSPIFKIPVEFTAICPNSQGVISKMRKNNKSIKPLSISFAKVSITKTGETSCGDTSGIYVTDDDRCIISIADGMGSGKNAAKESEKVTTLLKVLLEKGFEKKDALYFINQSLIADNNEVTMGLDMMFIDLINGQCEMLKADAAPTFVIRQENIFEVGEASLPIGILEPVSYYNQKCSLVANDILIMVSDGLLSDGSKKLAESIKKAKQTSLECMDIANEILKTTNIQDDDATIVVAKIA